jgi:hypothetical protein
MYELSPPPIYSSAALMMQGNNVMRGNKDSRSKRTTPNYMPEHGRVAENNVAIIYRSRLGRVDY